MKKLKALIQNIDYETHGELPAKISNLISDSRLAQKGDLFFALKGYSTDGHLYLQQVEKAGATCAIVEEFDKSLDLPQIKVADSKAALLSICPIYFDYPTQNLSVIGITGTNGKTTTTYLASQILQKTGHTTGTIGTYGYTINDKTYKTDLTTPDILQLYRIFHKMKDSGIEYLVMEVSSHAIALNRVKNLIFDGVVFTNISRDHLDFHKTLDQYAATKARLFSQVKKSGFCIVNREDSYAPLFLNAATGDCYTFSLSEPTDYRFSKKTSFTNGINGQLIVRSKLYDFHSPLSGEFNMRNLLAALAICHHLNIPMVYILNAIRQITPPPGRLEEISVPGKARFFIDYAHTPDAIKNALKALKAIVPEKGRLISIFGCGGNRDKSKRPLMAEASETFADLSILTTDNPRFEHPKDIIKDAEKGFRSKKNYIIVTDRKEAILRVVKETTQSDIVAILGKGHETYQDINGEKIDFDDKQIVKDALDEN